jgi:hypothetical protein
MVNPLEFKHDITSRPLKWLFDELSDSDSPPTDAELLVLGYVGFMTAGANLFPALGLIEAGVRGDTLFSHVTYKRFNPWVEPVFHYTQAASKAERIGGVVGGAVLGALHKPAPHFLYKAPKGAWVKAGAKAGAKVGGRLIPGVGWALLAYDVYDVAFNHSLWGFDF